MRHLLVLLGVLVASAVPITLAYRARSHHGQQQVNVDRGTVGQNEAKLTHGVAQQQVLAALAATTGANNYDLTYSIVETPPTSAAPTTTAPCPTPTTDGHAVFAVACPSTLANLRHTVTGKGTVNVAPKAMVAAARIDGGLNVTARVDSEHVWESGGAYYGLAPNTGAGSGQSISGFASLTEGTLGNRAGATAMIAMASPNGYLVLDQQSITGAAQIGTSTVGGRPVTVYEVGIDSSRLANLPGLSSDERTAITEALDLMRREGYADTRVRVSVDDAGFIRRAASTDRYRDGGTVTLHGTYSNFGCAGTVVMPGQSAPPSTSTACVSPDATPTTTTTTPSSVPSTSPNSSVPATSAPATTVAPAPTSVPPISSPASSNGAPTVPTVSTTKPTGSSAPAPTRVPPVSAP